MKKQYKSFNECEKLWDKYNECDLFSFYTKPSKRKKCIFENLRNQYGYFNVCVIGGNCSYFTALARCKDDDGSIYYVYITYAHDYIIKNI